MDNPEARPADAGVEELERQREEVSQEIQRLTKEFRRAAERHEEISAEVNRSVARCTYYRKKDYQGGVRRERALTENLKAERATIKNTKAQLRTDLMRQRDLATIIDRRLKSLSRRR